MTTRNFPGLGHDAMALTLNGKRNRLSRQDFGRAATMDLRQADASDVVDKLCAALRRHLAEVSAADPSAIRAQDEWRSPLDDLSR